LALTTKKLVLSRFAGLPVQIPWVKTFDAGAEKGRVNHLSSTWSIDVNSGLSGVKKMGWANALKGRCYR
jgi:hypothetical protein